MPWLYFKERFEYRPNLRCSIHYKAGSTYNVPTPAAEQATAAGKAIPGERKKRPVKAKAKGAPQNEGD